MNSLQNQANSYKKEIEQLKNEKNSLEEMINKKIFETKKSLMGELNSVDDSLHSYFYKKGMDYESQRQQVMELKLENTALQQQLFGLQRRIAELELQIGKNN